MQVTETVRVQDLILATSELQRISKTLERPEINAALADVAVILQNADVARKNATTGLDPETGCRYVTKSSGNKSLAEVVELLASEFELPEQMPDFAKHVAVVAGLKSGTKIVSPHGDWICRV